MADTAYPLVASGYAAMAAMLFKLARCNLAIMIREYEVWILKSFIRNISLPNNQDRPWRLVVGLPNRFLQPEWGLVPFCRRWRQGNSLVCRRAGDEIKQSSAVAHPNCCSSTTPYHQKQYIVPLSICSFILWHETIGYDFVTILCGEGENIPPMLIKLISSSRCGVPNICSRPDNMGRY